MNKQRKTNSCHPELVSGSSRSIKGFTLIELLVVVLIIGILAAVAVPQYQLIVEKSRVVEAITHIRALLQAEQVYHLANGTYATSMNELDITTTGTKDWSESLVLHFANDKFHIYTWRTGKEAHKGRWFVSGFLPDNSIYCGAYMDDTFSMNVCKKIGHETTCPWEVPDKFVCYRI